MKYSEIHKMDYIVHFTNFQLILFLTSNLIELTKLSQKLLISRKLYFYKIKKNKK